MHWFPAEAEAEEQERSVMIAAADPVHPDLVSASARLITRQIEGSRKPSLGRVTVGLCERCEYGQVMRRSAPKGVAEDAVVYCRAMGRRVPPDIAECTAFRDPKRMTLPDMLRIALAVDPRVGVNDRSYR